MTIEELAEECRKQVSCSNCSYTEYCNIVRGVLEDMSPMGLVEMVEKTLLLNS